MIFEKTYSARAEILSVSVNLTKPILAWSCVPTTSFAMTHFRLGRMGEDTRQFALLKGLNLVQVGWIDRRMHAWEGILHAHILIWAMASDCT